MSLRQTLKKLAATELLVTPYLEAWLVQNPDHWYSPETAQQIADVMVTQPRDRSASFSASAAGTCPRRQEFQYLGVKQGGSLDTRLSMIFVDGKWRHMRWQAVLLDAGILDSIEVPLRDKRLRVKGSMDGMGETNGHPYYGDGVDFGFELKGTNDFAYRGSKYTGPKPAHLAQVDRYFLVSGLEMFSLLYEDKNSQQWQEWVIQRDETRVKQARKDLVELNTAIDTKTLHPIQTECLKGEGDARYCPYVETCLKTGSWI